MWLTLATMAMQMASAPASAPCPAGGAPLPPPLAAFATPAPLRDGGVLSIDRAATLMLSAAPHFAVAPAKPPSAGTFGGTATFRIARQGRYRVALDAGTWVDVVQRGVAARSVAHGHGPACSKVRKMVDYDLAPGDYVLELSGAASASVTVLIARAG